jgi:hypothetical protein
VAWSALVLAAGLAPASAQFTPGEQTQMVSGHNTVRQDVDPIAMPMLASQSWSGTRGTAAQSHANACLFQHSFTPGVGENLFASSSDPPGDPPRPTPAAVVAAWASELAYYTYSTNACSPPPIPGTCGHYTAIVWRAATQLGCGIALCNPVGNAGTAGNPFGNGNTWWLVVCQYNAIQSGARPYLCDYDGNGSATDVCSDAFFADGFEETQALPGDWGGKAP